MEKTAKSQGFHIDYSELHRGVIYNDLGLRFDSPTINLFIKDDNFIKLVLNLQHYLTVEPKALCEYVDPYNSAIHYPKILIDDIEVCCLHYKNCDEAIEAWNKRRKRVHFDNVFVIGNSWDLHEDYDKVKQLLQNPYKTIVFTFEEINDEKRCVHIPGKEFVLDEHGVLRPNITDFMPNSPYKYFERYFDFVGWLNDQPT